MTLAQFFLGVAGGGALIFLLWRQARLKDALAATAAEALFRDVEALLESVERKPGDTTGSWKVVGRRNGEVFQFTTVTDTLAVQKLPNLWLVVTLQKTQPVMGIYDVMMRPSAHSAFSRFDFLPRTLPRPEDFPAEAVLRTDEGAGVAPLAAMRLGLPVLHTPQGKELVISPNGLRIVIHLAEADKARYGLFREARFDHAAIDTELAVTLMNTLLAMDRALASSHG